MKTHWKKLENPDYIGAYSLEDGKDLVVTVETVKREMVIGQGGKKEECTIAHLKGQKPFILNRTNMKMIQKIYDTPYIEEWTGKKLTLCVAKIRAFGEENVECLRIRPVAPELPELKPNTTLWQEAIKALSNGFTIDQIKQKYTVSNSNQEKLMNESI